MQILRVGLFVFTLSFCIVSICAARSTFNLFADDAPSGASESSSARAAAAAAGISSTSSSSSTSASVLSLSYATLSAFSTSLIALLYSTHLFSTRLDNLLMEFPGLSTPSTSDCCASSSRNKNFDSYLSCACPDSEDDDSTVSVNAPSDDVEDIHMLHDGKSTCSIGDDFMSCRTPPKNQRSNKRKRGSPEVKVDPGQELFKVLIEGEYASTFCAVDGSIGCSAESACFQLGLCTSPSTHNSPDIGRPGLQLYKPPIVSLPTPPQSTHLLSALLGPSSKTTLLLRAFAKGIYKFNNMSVMSSIPTLSSEDALRKDDRPVPISTFTVVSAPTEAAPSGLFDEAHLDDDVPPKHIEPTVELSDVVGKQAEPVVVSESIQPNEAEKRGEPQQTDSNATENEPKESRPQSLRQRRSNKSTEIATRINVREVLAASERTSSSCLALVVAMLCFVAMGM